jgi:aminocarboxymuconate-semialdehyde decarboxylase
VTTVDIHAHVIPEPIIALARARRLFGVEQRDGTLFHPEGFRAPLGDDFFDADVILARMDEAEIDVSILSLSPTLFFYGQPASDAVAFARTANAAIASLVARSERLLGLAHLPMQDPAAAVRELQRAVEDLGFCGALIGTSVDQTPLDAEHVLPVLEAAERLRVPLILHPYFVGPKPGLEPFYFTNTIGNPLDTTIAAARLVHSGVLGRLPGLNVILVHGGGYLPYQLGRFDHAFRARPETRELIAEPPGRYIRRFWIDTLTHSDPALEFLAKLVGSDRLLVGSDLPYDMADRYPLARLRRVGLDGNALGSNAQKLFQSRSSLRPGAG